MIDPLIETSAAGVDDMYDRHAAGYDRLIGSRLYNSLVWGTDTDDYAQFSWRAVASGSGPFLEVAAGSCLVSAEAYAASNREVVVTDRSAHMLGEAVRRLTGAGGVRPHTRFVQADAFALPFPEGAFETVGCFGFLHIVEDPVALVDHLRAQLRPGGKVFISSLVTGTRLGTWYLAQLHRTGVVATPRSADELADLFQVQVLSRGSMAYLELPAR